MSNIIFFDESVRCPGRQHLGWSTRNVEICGHSPPPTTLYRNWKYLLEGGYRDTVHALQQDLRMVNEYYFNCNQTWFWSIATTLVSIETTKCYLSYNMYSAILRIYHHDVHTGWFPNLWLRLLPYSFLKTRDILHPPPKKKRQRIDLLWRNGSTFYLQTRL